MLNPFRYLIILMLKPNPYGEHSNFRRHFFWPCVSSGVLIIGPIISYLTTLVSFGLGLVSSVGLTSYAFQTLMAGSFIGLVASFICIIYRCQVFASALSCMVISFLSELLSISNAYRADVISTIGWTPFIGSALIHICGAGLAGYATATVVNHWINRQHQKPSRTH